MKDLATITKFRTFIKYKDLPEQLREAALICYDADYCEKSYNDEGDLIFDKIYIQNVEHFLKKAFSEEKTKAQLLLDFMNKFQVNFIED